eukprot:m.21264 g.21264  ORF g.21264 m.21264 type:complete len:127 (-) comp9067_c0_seq1:181-561(-)
MLAGELQNPLRSCGDGHGAHFQDQQPSMPVAMEPGTTGRCHERQQQYQMRPSSPSYFEGFPSTLPINFGQPVDDLLPYQYSLPQSSFQPLQALQPLLPFAWTCTSAVQTAHCIATLPCMPSLMPIS